MEVAIVLLLQTTHTHVESFVSNRREHENEVKVKLRAAPGHDGLAGVIWRHCPAMDWEPVWVTLRDGGVHWVGILERMLLRRSMFAVNR